jgi:3-oxoacyl-[acyl-carrier protein] reductase
MARLTNKVAIVTGASRGIGAAIAKRLAADGAKVVVNYALSREAAEEVVRSIGANAVAVRADLSDVAQIKPLVDAAIQNFGKLDILVNNAAIAEPGVLKASNAQHFARHFDLNVRGVLLATREAVAHMSEGGRVINISSGIVRARVAGSAVYAASKAAIEAMARCHAAELGKRKITVNCVAPGLTDTDMLRDGIPAEAKQMLVAQTPLGRLGTPEDIAQVVAFIASDEAAWITGEVIPANGGLG